MNGRIKFAGHTMGTPGRDIYEVIDLFKKIGYDGIEVRVAADGQIDSEKITDGEARKILAAAKKQGMEFACLTSYYADFVDPEKRPETIAKLKRVANFVRLEMPNQVPHRAVYARGLLPGRLLHLVFPDNRKPRLPGLLHDFRPVGLRDGDDLDLGGVPPRAAAGVVYPAAHVGKYFVKRPHAYTRARRTSFSYFRTADSHSSPATTPLRRQNSAQTSSAG